MVSEQEVLMKGKRESFLYRVFRADSVRELEQQQFTYLGAEIYFDEQGKVYRYEEPVFDFDGFHAFIKDKYDHYQIDEFILVTREGQFNIRYFPLTEYSPEEHTELVDDVELIGFRMFPDLLPIGADLLLSVLDKDPMEDVENSIGIFQKILRLIVNDENQFLNVQILMNLVECYLALSDIEKSIHYVNQVAIIVENSEDNSLKYCKLVRMDHQINDQVLGEQLFIYDLGHIVYRQAYFAQLTNSVPIFEIKDMYTQAISFWDKMNTKFDELTRCYFNLAEILLQHDMDVESSETYYRVVIQNYDPQEITDFSQHLMHISSLVGIFDLENAEKYINSLDQSNLSALEKYLIALIYGKIHLSKDPKQAYSTFLDAVDLLQTVELPINIYVGLFSYIIDSIYLNRDTAQIKEITSLQIYRENKWKDEWEIIWNYCDTINLILNNPFQSIKDTLLDRISLLHQTHEKDQRLAKKLLWIYIREFVANFSFQSARDENITTLGQINTIAENLQDTLILSTVNTIRELFETRNEFDVNFFKDRINQVNQLVPLNVKETTVSDLIEYLFIRYVILIEEM